jgi:uncharacterized membrane protein YkgB
MDRHALRRGFDRSSAWSSNAPSLKAALNVTFTFILLIASAVLGLATGLFFRVWTIASVSLLIAILSAIFLRSYGFGFAGGVSITVGCLVISQVAYIAGAFIEARMCRTAELTQEEIDGDPSGGGEQNVRDDDK